MHITVVEFGRAIRNDRLIKCELFSDWRSLTPQTGARLRSSLNCVLLFRTLRLLPVTIL